MVMRCDRVCGAVDRRQKRTSNEPPVVRRQNQLGSRCVLENERLGTENAALRSPTHQEHSLFHKFEQDSMSALLKRTLRSGAVLANSARAASRALSTATDEAQQPRIERFGPVNCTVKGAAAEQGQPQKSWKDEPVPSTSVSPDVPFPG